MSTADFKSARNKKDSNVWQSARTGRWHWEVQLVRPDGTEFRRSGSKKTEPAARASRDEAFAEFNRTQGRAGRWTLGTWAAHVQESVWPEELSPTTSDAYAYALKNHILPKLGSARLDALTVPTLQEWLNKLKATKGVNVASNVRTPLSNLLTRAVQNGLIQSNPARHLRLKLSGPAEESKMILTPSQQERLMKAAIGTPMEMPVLLGLKFGLRMGEALGLRWADIDLEGRELHVRRQAQYVKGKGIQLSNPKTASGTRTIPIPDGVLPLLQRAKDATSSIYVTMNGTRAISAKRASNFFRKVALAANFSEEEGIPTHHDLRSTFLSHLALRRRAIH